MQFLKKLFLSLNEMEVRYMVAGGVAVNLYGIERATADVDLVLSLSPVNLAKFVKAVRKLGLRPKAPVPLEDLTDAGKRKTWIEEKGMKVFSLYDPKNPFFLLDVFVELPFDFDAVYRRRKRLVFEETTIPVVPLKDLIAMKERADRPQDRADVYYLKRILEGWKDEA